MIIGRYNHMDKLVARLAQSLVDRPGDVRVRTIESEHTLILELHVAKSDVGKVIGKQGRTAQALRILVGAASSKCKCRSILQIIE